MTYELLDTDIEDDHDTDEIDYEAEERFGDEPEDDNSDDDLDESDDDADDGDEEDEVDEEEKAPAPPAPAPDPAIASAPPEPPPAAPAPSQPVDYHQVNYFDEILSQVPEEHRTMLYNTARRLAIPEGDALFLYLLAIHYTVSLCDGIPRQLRQIQTEGMAKLRSTQGGYLDEMEQKLKAVDRIQPLVENAFQEGSQTLKDTMAMAERVAVAEQKRWINQIAAEWSRTQFVEAQKSHWAAIALPFSALCLTLLTAGGVFGWAVTRVVQPVASKPVVLSLQQVEALRWAESDDGKLGRNLVEWNASSLQGQSCLKLQELNAAAAQSSGVVPPTVEAKGGCYLWIDPPEKREFKRTESK